jgi:hypothetical protein
MSQNSSVVAEISALRYQLLGRSESMLSATQYTCRCYLAILLKLAEAGDKHAAGLRSQVLEINESLDRSALFRNQRAVTDIVQKSMTDLRMIMDMHLHNLDVEHSRRPD